MCTGPAAGHLVGAWLAVAMTTPAFLLQSLWKGPHVPSRAELRAAGPVPGLLGRPSSLAEPSCCMTDVPAAAGSPG